ncbi:MAG: hypothetical protein IJ733_05955 [Lachnospiraceae bacterium]|nr:hypothetical protein [Lachnospiraceae bacterium]
MVFLVMVGLFFTVTAGTILILMVVGLVDVIIGMFLLPAKDVAFEYVFVDGQIDFDCIYKGEKRKTLQRIDMEKVEFFAPASSHAWDSYKQLPLVDYASGFEPEKDYIALHQGEKGMEKISFTPDEKMLSMIDRKSPSKLKK